MISKENITGIILAGGKSSRMGTDKGMLLLNEKTFIQNIIDAMKPLVNNIIIVSDNEEHAFLEVKRTKDIIKNAGPLAGLYSGLHRSRTEDNLVLSCDVPLINTAILKELTEQINNDFDVVQLKSQGKTMPLIATYKKLCATKCLELLGVGERRLRFAVKQLNTKTIELDPRLDKYVRNVNTTNELKNLKNDLEH